MDRNSGILITKPTHFLNKEITIKSHQEFLKALTKLFSSVAFAQFQNLPSHLTDLMVQMNLVLNEGETAWLLISLSFREALHELIDEYIEECPATETNILENSLEKILGDSELKINNDFFYNSHESTVVKNVSQAFYSWLLKQTFEDSMAKFISDKLQSYFPLALLKELKNKHIFYSKLNAPITKHIEQRQSWVRNEYFLRKQVEKKLLIENISLKQVYVPLRAYYEASEHGNSVFIGDRSDQPKRVVVDLSRALKTWLKEQNTGDEIRLISGGPGSGKSSFAQMFAAEVAADKTIPVLYIPIHLFDISKDFVDAIGTYVNKYRILPYNPLGEDEPEPRLLIIFDGLDELAMQGKIAEGKAREFLSEVRKITYKPKPELKVIITGRELFVQLNDEVKSDHRILKLLPYFIKTDERFVYHDENKILQCDQRAIWWRNYGEVIGKKYEDLPDSLASDNLIEITSQPLLNYFIAFYIHSGIPVTEETNLNCLYYKLINEIYSRRYDPSGVSKTNSISLKEFYEILQQIALAVWHGNGRTTTEKEINHKCKTDHMQSLMKRFAESYQSDPQKNVTRLMTAFYFKKNGSDDIGDSKFEFTHKSFGEYLTAVSIVGVLKKLSTMRKDPSYSEYNSNKALIRWAEDLGPKPIDQYLCQFILNEIRLAEIDVVSDWQETLTELLNYVLIKGMPMKAISESLSSFNDANVQIINAEKALLIVLNCCAQVTKNNSIINQNAISYYGFGDWIARWQSPSREKSPCPVLNSLSFLTIKKSRLNMRNLRNVNFEQSVLNESYLNMANFRNGNFKRARLENANLVDAYLKQSDFSGASLANAKLQRANLQQVNLQGADLQGANLSETKLQGANLQNANLTKAILSGANLQDADLRGATVKNAVFDGAYLEGTLLKGVNMDDTTGAPTNPLQSELTILDTFKLGLDEKLRDCITIKNVCELAIEYLRNSLNCQIACIYLMDKDGYIVRESVNGIDRFEERIPQSWLYNDNLKKTEPYTPGQGFTGKGIPEFGKNNNQQRTRSMHSDHLDIEHKDKENYPYGNQYFEILGDMKSGMKDCIVGNSRAYGSIDVFNKKDKQKNLVSFTTNDYLFLKITSSSVATYISNIRSHNRNLIFRSLLDGLFKILTKPLDLNDICNKLAMSLISEPTPYKVCVIRILKNDTLSDLALQHTDDIVWHCTRPQQDSQDNITRYTINVNNFQYIENIDDYFKNTEKYKFKLRYTERYTNNNLKSIFCFPLSFQNKAFGTITILVGYPYKFSVEEKDFMFHIANFLGYIIRKISHNSD